MPRPETSLFLVVSPLIVSFAKSFRATPPATPPHMFLPRRIDRRAREFLGTRGTCRVAFPREFRFIPAVFSLRIHREMSRRELRRGRSVVRNFATRRAKNYVNGGGDTMRLKWRAKFFPWEKLLKFGLEICFQKCRSSTGGL